MDRTPDMIRAELQTELAEPRKTRAIRERIADLADELNHATAVEAINTRRAARGLPALPRLGQDEEVSGWPLPTRDEIATARHAARTGDRLPWRNLIARYPEWADHGDAADVWAGDSHN